MRRLLLLAAITAACSDDSPGSRPTDAGLDARVAPNIDAARDAAGPSDASPDARSADAAVDAEIDAGFDAGIPCDAAAKPVLPALRLQVVPGAESIAALVFAAQAPGSDDWYLVQQSGTIRVLRQGALLPAPFLDVSSELPALDERGLLSIAFPPDYAQSGKFYIALTASGGANANQDSVYEYQRAPDGTSSRVRTMVQLPASAANHNGGTVLFGPDGFLYYGTGDGGGGCNSDKPGAPQDPGSLFGKILRLDPKAPEPHGAAGNPFAGDAGDSRVLHTGLRNPFRFGFDRVVGGLFIGDVGQSNYEELDYAAPDQRGLDYGWPAIEGPDAGTGTCMGPLLGLRDGSVPTYPIASFQRFAANPFTDYTSVIGGPTYRGSAIPSLQGVTLFGDYTGVRMGALVQCGSQTSDISLVAKNRDPNQPSQASFARPDGSVPFTNLFAIVEDNAGELYFVVNASTLYKVVAGE